MEKARKYSRKREAILQAIRSTDSHPCAEWVYATLKPKYPDLSLGTVYRNIAQFKEEGAIISVGVVDGQDRLDGRTQPHSHFICQKCGKVFDLDVLRRDAELDARIARDYDCEVAYHNLVFHGRCKNCLKP